MDAAQHRSFCDVLEDEGVGEAAATQVVECEPGDDEGLAGLRAGVIGRLEPFATPFGDRPLVYADWTASGRAHAAVEDFVAREVLPLYGNTHTTTSITGRQSTCFRHEARQMVAEACNAKVTGKAAEDVVLFCGSGATGCVAKLVQLLGLDQPLPAGQRNRPVVLVGPMEHHSNLLPWRESCALVVAVRPDPARRGPVCLVHLEELLRLHAPTAPLVVGTFAAASNVTGLVERVNAVTATLHKHGALSFWDYATAVGRLPSALQQLGHLSRCAPDYLHCFLPRAPAYFCCAADFCWRAAASTRTRRRICPWT